MTPNMERALMLLPFLLFLFLAGVCVLFAQWMQHRRREFAHRERLSALEKGLPVPAESTSADAVWWRRPLAPEAYLLRGLLWASLGIGMLVACTAMAAIVSERSRPIALAWAFVGFVPACLGAGYVLYYWLSRKSGRS